MKYYPVPLQRYINKKRIEKILKSILNIPPVLSEKNLNNLVFLQFNHYYD